MALCNSFVLRNKQSRSSSLRISRSQFQTTLTIQFASAWVHRFALCSTFHFLQVHSNKWLYSYRMNAIAYHKLNINLRYKRQHKGHENTRTTTRRKAINKKLHFAIVQYFVTCKWPMHNFITTSHYPFTTEAAFRGRV